MPLARSSRTRAVGAVAALVVATGALTLLPGGAPPAAAAGLVPYGGCDELLAHYREQLARAATPYGGGGVFAAVEDSAGGATAATASGEARAVSAGAGPAGPTGTNVQEAGVDEPDVAKTADGLLLVAGQGGLQVLTSGAEPELLSTWPLHEAWGAELLVQGDRVLVLVPGAAEVGPAQSRRPGWGGPEPVVRGVLLDLADPRRPRLVEQMELDGRYLSARLSGGAVRLVTSSRPQPGTTSPQEPYGPAEERAALEANRTAAQAVTLGQVLPQVVRRDRAGTVLADGRAVDCDAVRHAPSAGGASMLLVTTLDLTRGLAPQDATAVTADGDLVYASADRLYVATSRWSAAGPTRPRLASDSPTAEVDQVTTELHGFDTSAPTVTAYVGSGSVPGYVLGRWALSSHEGHLRVATTSAPPWNGPEQSESTVTVLAETSDGLVERGSVGGLGVTEQIRAVRWFGDLATVVTFRQTDPLYVLDVGTPTAPRVLGELKVPGFSSYLHPVGDGLLLGVGSDADAEGRVTGMKVSLFDLTDLSAPREADTLLLGQGWTPVEHDSRAFGWDAARGLALLPRQTYDGRTGSTDAVAVRVTADRRLVLHGALPVAAPEGLVRVLHDDEHLYAVGAHGLVAGDLDTMARTGRAVFPPQRAR